MLREQERLIELQKDSMLNLQHKVKQTEKQLSKEEKKIQDHQVTKCKNAEFARLQQELEAIEKNNSMLKLIELQYQREIDRRIKQQEKEIKHTEELINKFRAKQSKAAFAQSLIKKLEKTERIEIEKEDYSGIRISFPLSVQPGKWVLEMSDVGKSYGPKVLFKNISLSLNL